MATKKACVEHLVVTEPDVLRYHTLTHHTYTHTHTGRLVPGSPAELCNQLYVYDELLAVNGQDVSQVDHDDIVNLIKSSGTSIHLTVQQPEGVCMCMWAITYLSGQDKSYVHIYYGRSNYPNS